MHPEIMRQVVAQRQHDALIQARQARAAKQLKISRRHREPVADAVVIPAIPDYVDGTFRLAAGEVPASRTAA